MHRPFPVLELAQHEPGELVTIEGEQPESRIEVRVGMVAVVGPPDGRIRVLVTPVFGERLTEGREEGIFVHAWPEGRSIGAIVDHTDAVLHGSGKLPGDRLANDCDCGGQPPGREAK